MQTKSCKKGRLSFFVLLIFSLPAFSANGHIYLGASIAASSAKLGDSDPQISYQSGTTITDAYPLNDDDASTSVGGLNGGYEFTLDNKNLAIALGLGFYDTLSDYDYSGQLIETAAGDPSATLYDYNYSVSSKRLMAEMKLTWLLGKIYPFVNAGVGAAWNKMDDYTEVAATSNGYVPLPPFQSHTDTNFAYQVGVGIGTAFNFHGQSDFLHERISVGYQYANLGDTTFGTRGSLYPYQLNTGSLTTNEVLLCYTHLF